MVHLDNIFWWSYMLYEKLGVSIILQFSQRNGKLPLTQWKQGNYPLITIYDGGGWPSRRIFPEAKYPYRILSLDFFDGDNLILTSVSNRLCLISFSATPEEDSPEELGSATDNVEVEQWWDQWYPPLRVSFFGFLFRQVTPRNILMSYRGDGVEEGDGLSFLSTTVTGAFSSYSWEEERKSLLWGGPIEQNSFTGALKSKPFQGDSIGNGEKGNIWFNLEKVEGAPMQYSATAMIARHCSQQWWQGNLVPTPERIDVTLSYLGLRSNRIASLGPWRPTPSSGWAW